MVFGHAVALSGQVVVVCFGWELHGETEVGRQQSAIGETDALVPEELDRVAVPGHALVDHLTARDRRAVSSDEMLGAEREEVVDPGQQHLRIAVLLSADGEDVEQHRPHEVVDRDAE